MVAFVASATDTNTSGVDETSITITKPSGTLEGHFMVAVVAGYLPATLTPPSGWALFYGPVNSSTGLYSWCFIKTAGSSEPSNYTWTWSGTGGALNGSISTFSDASGIDSVYVIATGTNDPASVNSIKTTRDTVGYAVYCWRDTTIDTCTTTLTGGTERFDVGALDVGTIARGQAGYTYTKTTTYPATSSEGSIDPTNSVTHGIMWNMGIGDAAASNESWASTGFGVELELNSTWTDISSYVRASGGINIKRGSSSESTTFEPSQLSMMLDNTDGRFSPRNPTGAYFGQIGRNTPVRVHKAQGTVALQLQGERGDFMRTSGTDPLDITGDIDIRIDVEPRAWKQAQTLAARHEDRFTSRVWRFYLDEEGFLKFTWSDDSVTEFTATSTLPVPMVKRQALRVTLDVNNGASGNDVNFYYADAIGSSYTQLGSTVTQSGTTSLYSFPAPIMIGQTLQTTDQGSYAPNFHGLVYGFELRDGIAGTLVSDIDFTAQTTGTYSLTENDNVWIAYGNAVISNRNYRFYGEISEWPARWDTTGTDIYTPVEGAGISRRLGQGSEALKSAMFRFCSVDHTDYDGVVPDTNTAVVRGYWPFEDGENATRISSGLAGGKEGVIYGGSSPTFATYEGFKASASLMAFKTGMHTYHQVKGSTAGRYEVQFLLSAPSGITNGATIVRVNNYSGSTPFYMDLTYPSTDNLTATFYDLDGTVLGTSTFGVSIVGELLLISILAYDDGSDVAWAVYSREITATTSTLEGSGTLTSVSVGRVTSLEFGRDELLNDVYIGHAVVWETDPGTAAQVEPLAINAFFGEDAGTRIQRLCREESVEFRQVGNTESQADLTVFFNGDGQSVGYQTQQQFLSLLDESKVSGQGLLYEPRDVLGIEYRTLDSLYQIPATLTLDYSTFDLSGNLEPTEDDRYIINAMTVSRKDGASAMYEETVGPLSTQAPPDGIGKVAGSESLSLELDSQALQAAGWLVHLGTVDEARYPKIDLALENPRFAADATLVSNLLKLDIGDRVVIQNPPSWLPPEDISVIVLGYTESLDKFTHDFSLVCVPASSYVNVGFADVSETGRVDTDNSNLSASASSSGTSLTVATDSGSAVWIDSATYASDFNFDIMVGGERMTVTAITGTSSPQTFTVTRSVNGVTKSHASGTEVHVFQPVYVAL